MTTKSTDSPPSSSLPSSVIFPLKLHRLLDEATKHGYETIISWLPDGKSFKVHDAERFATEIMPTYFGSNKYRSFQKNLNMWSFKAERKGKCSHPLFRQGQPKLVHQMKRQLTSHQMMRQEQKRQEEEEAKNQLSILTMMMMMRGASSSSPLQSSPSTSSSLFGNADFAADKNNMMSISTSVTSSALSVGHNKNQQWTSLLSEELEKKETLAAEVIMPQQYSPNLLLSSSPSPPVTIELLGRSATTAIPNRKSCLNGTNNNTISFLDTTSSPPPIISLLPVRATISPRSVVTSLRQLTSPSVGTTNMITTTTTSGRPSSSSVSSSSTLLFEQEQYRYAALAASEQQRRIEQRSAQHKQLEQSIRTELAIINELQRRRCIHNTTMMMTL